MVQVLFREISAVNAINSVSWLEYAAVAIAALSFISSFVFGLWNRRTSKRALELSEQQEARLESKLSSYLNESISWRLPEEAIRVLGIHLQITNPTDRPTALVRSELHLTYSRDGVLTTVKIAHGLEHEPPGSGTELTPVDLPEDIDSNSAIQGWFFFQISDGLVEERPIERYDIVVRDIHDVLMTRQVTVFREVFR